MWIILWKSELEGHLWSLQLVVQRETRAAIVVSHIPWGSNYFSQRVEAAEGGLAQQGGAEDLAAAVQPLHKMGGQQ